MPGVDQESILSTQNDEDDFVILPDTIVPPVEENGFILVSSSTPSDSISSCSWKATAKHLSAPVLAGGGKFLGMASVVFAFGGPGVAAYLVGGLAGLANFYVEYHYTTKAVVNAGNAAAITQQNNAALNARDQTLAMVVFASSLAQGGTDGYKAFLKTGGMLPMAIPATLLGQASHFHSNAHKCFYDVTGKNLNDTWIGKMNCVFTLDYHWFNKNIFDMKYLIATFYPEFEVALQIAAVLSAAKKVSINHPAIIAAVSLYSVYGLYYRYKGYGQEVMKASLELEGQHKGLAKGVNSFAERVSKLVDVVVTVPNDALISILVSPKVALWGSTLVDGLTGGFATFHEGFERLPPSIGEKLVDFPAWAAGLIGAGLTTTATCTQFLASLKPTTSSANGAVKKIGVEAMAIERFGSVDVSMRPADIASRAKCYGSYLSSTATNCCRFFPAVSVISDPGVTEKLNVSLSSAVI
jgi:hypothetical protein